MDPNATLTELRSLVVNHEGNTTPEHDQLVELFSDLDEWISKGGVLPAAWQGETR